MNFYISKKINCKIMFIDELTNQELKVLLEEAMNYRKGAKGKNVSV